MKTIFRKINDLFRLVSVGIMAFVVLSCTEIMTETDASSLRIEVSNYSPEIGVLTKGPVIDDINTFTSNIVTFTLSAFKGTSSELDDVNMNYDSDYSYVPATTYYWNPTVELQMFAVAPMVSEISSLSNLTYKPASQQLNLKYSLPTGTKPSEMIDFMLAWYKGNGLNGRAVMCFNHPLSAVSFVSGNVPDMKVNSVKMTSISNSADLTATFSKNLGEPDCVWVCGGSVSDYSYTPSSPITLHKSVEGEPIATGDNTFILIPQTPSSSSKLVLNITMDGETKDMVCDNDLVLEPGFHYTVAFNYSSGVLSVKPVNVRKWIIETVDYDLN